MCAAVFGSVADTVSIRRKKDLLRIRFTKFVLYVHVVVVVVKIVGNAIAANQKILAQVRM